MKAPQPNYEFFVEAMQNKKPARMPIYEHHIDPGFIEKVINADDVVHENESKYYTIWKKQLGIE